MALIPRPAHMFVGAHTYRIEWLNSVEWTDVNEDPGNDGVTRSGLLLIRLQLTSGRPESHYQESLVHEILHAASDYSGFVHMKYDALPDLEETMCSVMAPPLLFVLKQNPQVSKYLLSDGTVVR